MTRVAFIDPASFTLPYDLYYLKSIESKVTEVDFFASETILQHDYLKFFKDHGNINSQIFNISRKNKILGLFQYTLLLLRVLRNYSKYEYIHFQWSIFFLLELPFFLLFRKKLIFTFHNPVPHDYSKQTYFPYKIIFSLAKQVQFVSEFSLENFIVRYNILSRKKISLVPHPLLPISPLYEKIQEVIPRQITRTIVFWGNVKRYKGVDFFLDLLQSKQFNHYHFEIHGRWDQELAGTKEELSAHSRLYLSNSFLSDSEIYSLMQRNVIFLLPYKSGSQSGVVNTLKYYNKKYLCTAVGEQQFEDEKHIFSVDNLDDLYQKLESLVKS